MEIGSYGNTVFEVSADRVRTFGVLERSGSGRYAEHAVQEKKPVLQFLGPGLESVTLDVRLSASLGVNPLAEIETLRAVRDGGESANLMIGGKVLGRFVLAELTETWGTVSADGALLAADVNLTLTEDAHGA